MDNTPHHNQPEPSRPRGRYIPALDGIRTLAVAAVVLYHLNPALAPGGMQGVTVFFVLSGYLITHLLLNEFDASGRIDFKGFWVRRLRRLVPATVAVVVGVAALCTLFNHVMLTKMRGDIVPSLLYLNNWWQIFNNVSYFNNVGDPSPLTHFWSLAIEAQFYLLWPAALFLALKAGQPRTRIRRAALALAAVSALEMALLYNPAADPSRVYYGTDTRAFSLLVGAWLAFIPLDSLAGTARKLFAGAHSRPHRTPQMGAHTARGTSATYTARPKPTMRKAAPVGAHAAGVQAARASHAPEQSTFAADLLGVVGLAGTLALIAFSNGYTAFSYRGGILLASVCAAMLVESCVAPESHIAKLFELEPLVWLGQRSYSIYLWHYPLLILMNPASDVSQKPWWIYVLQVAIVIAVSAACYRFVETPFRRGALGKLVTRVRENRSEFTAWAKRNLALASACTLMGVIALGGLIFVPATSALSDEGAAMLQDGPDAGDAEQSAGAPENAPDGGQPSSDGTKLNASGFPEGSYDVTMIGDSVSLRVVEPFKQLFPHGTIDAMKNRQFTAGIEVYRSMLDQNLCGRVAIFALGTNGPVTDAMIDELMGLVGEKRIAVFVNNREPKTAWIGPNNDAFSRAAERYGNVRVIDWHGYSANRNDVFDGDGTHLNASGAQEYAQLIYDSVKAYLPVHLEDNSDPRLLAAQAALNGVRAALTLELHPIQLEGDNE